MPPLFLYLIWANIWGNTAQKFDPPTKCPNWKYFPFPRVGVITILIQYSSAIRQMAYQNFVFLGYKGKYVTSSLYLSLSWQWTVISISWSKYCIQRERFFFFIPFFSFKKQRFYSHDIFMCDYSNLLSTWWVQFRTCVCDCPSYSSVYYIHL